MSRKHANVTGVMKMKTGCSKSVDVIMKRKTSKSKSADVDVMKRKTSKRNSADVDVMKRKTSKSNSADVVVKTTARYTQLKLSFDFNVDKNKKKDIGGEAGDGGEFASADDEGEFPSDDDQWKIPPSGVVSSESSTMD